jgi:hypothetical protein
VLGWCCFSSYIAEATGISARCSWMLLLSTEWLEFEENCLELCKTGFPFHWMLYSSWKVLLMRMSFCGVWCSGFALLVQGSKDSSCLPSYTCHCQLLPLDAFMSACCCVVRWCFFIERHDTAWHCTSSPPSTIIVKTVSIWVSLTALSSSSVFSTHLARLLLLGDSELKLHFVFTACN